MTKEKQNKSSLKLWLLITAALLIPFGLLILYRANCQSEFDRRVTELAKEGYPVSLDDLEKQYVLPEGSENAADVYIEAFFCRQNPTAEEQEFLPTSGNYRWPHDVPPFPPEVMNALESYLQRNQKTLELLDQAAQIKHCAWPRTLQVNYFSNDYYTDIKRAAMLINERNLYLAQKGEADKLFNSFQTSIGLSKTLTEQPFLIDYLIVVALKAMYAQNLENILSQVYFTEAQLETLQQQFSEMQDINGLHDAMIVDRCCTIEFWRLPPEERGGTNSPAQLLYSASGLKNKGALLSLDGTEGNIKASQLPLHQRNEAFKRIEDEVNTGILSYIHLSLGMPASSMVKINQIDLRVMGYLKCAETALAIERYRNKHKSPPQSLDALVPEFMAEIPRDPFDNEVLRHLKLDKGFTLYTIGEDGIDNGGLSREQLREKTGENPKQYDWPFTVRR